jgi:hypothetical protein
VAEADRWEGVLAISGNRGERAHASVTAFPFRNGRRIRDGEEVAWVFVLEADGGGRVREIGWTAWDGPGEWGGVRAPGDLFRVHDVRLEDGRCVIDVGDLVGDRACVALHRPGPPWIRDPIAQVDVEEKGATVDLARIVGAESGVALRLSGLPFGAGEQSFVTGPVA